MDLNATEHRKLIDLWLEGPAENAPHGTTTDYLNGPSLHKYGVLCQSIFLTLTTVLILIRIYTKTRILKSLGWDDYTSFGAWLGLIALGIVLIEYERHGGGKHKWDITARDWLVYSRLGHGFQLSYTLDILLTKVSILLLYLRIFSPSRAVRTVIHVNLWANIVFYIICFFITLMLCVPREAIWNPYIQHAKCLNVAAGMLASAVFNVVSDFIILILPISTVWKLQMQRRKKVAVSAVFATGLLGCIAGLVRVGMFAEYLHPPWKDESWESYPMVLWSYIEISAGIICGCMPAVPAFCRHMRDCCRKSHRATPSDHWHSSRNLKHQGRQADDVEMCATTSGEGFTEIRSL